MIKPNLNVGCEKRSDPNITKRSKVSEKYLGIFSFHRNSTKKNSIPIRILPTDTIAQIEGLMAAFTASKPCMNIPVLNPPSARAMNITAKSDAVNT